MWVLDYLLSLPMLVVYLAIAGLIDTRARALAASGGDIRTLAALPKAHAANRALGVAVPAFAVFLVLGLANLIRPGSVLGNMVFWIVVAVPALGALGAIVQSNGGFRARIAFEAWVHGLLIACSSVAILTTVGIVLSMLFEAGNFFLQHCWINFFFSATWSPNFR